MVNRSHCSKLWVFKQTSVKLLFKNHLVLFIIPFTNHKYWRNDVKKKWAFFKPWHQEIQKLNFFRKNIWLNTTLNTFKMENILPKRKTYSLSTKIGLPRKELWNHLYGWLILLHRRPSLFIMSHLMPKMRILVY